MAPFGASAVPTLDKSGTNLWLWEAAFMLFAQANACDDLLNGVWQKPHVHYPDLQQEPDNYGTSAIPDEPTLRTVVAQVRADNSYRQETYRRELAALNRWKQSNAALQLAILNTVPRDLYEGVRHLPIDQQYKAIVARFRNSGVAEECTIWGNFFSLRAHHCPTTAVFTDQFKAGLAKINAIDCTITEKCEAYQFILAIEDVYPEYARNRRADLRRNVIPKVDQMCNKLNDEARRDDPVKAAYATLKQKAGNDNSQRRGHHNNNSNNNGNRKGGGDSQKPSQSTDHSRGPKCKHCGHPHAGAGDNCWYTFPEKAPPEWRERNADRLKSKSQRAGANTAIVSVNTAMDNFTFATVRLSDDVLRKANDSAYHDRLILDTGSTDHVCNDYGKFVKFDYDPSYHAVINTGAGPIHITRKGTITVMVATSSGTLHKMTFNDVLYAPDMFVSVLSHSKLKTKNLYYHGWHDALYLMPDDVEVAFTPEIDGIPTLMLANDETEAAQAFAFAAVHSTTQLSLDVSFHVGYLARAMSKPTQRHYDYASQVIDYLNTTKDLVVTYKAPAGTSLTFDMFVITSSTGGNINLDLHAYSDALFADGEDRKSTSGYLFKLAGGTVCHKSAKQRLVTTSTTEAEYVALTIPAKEATWLHRLLHQLRYTTDDTHPILIKGDNEPSIKLLQAKGHHERTKHVDLYYHYIKERVRDGKLKVQHVRTTAMAADGLTKPLERVAYNRFPLPGWSHKASHHCRHDQD